jgi:fermentation-respiration switch protein FrsA (DUF1100 family)
MATLKWILIVAVVGYLGLGALMFFVQRALMYFPERERTPPPAAGLPQAEEVMLDTADGERIIVWHVPPRGDKPVVLYLHGNGGSLRYRADRFRTLAENGVGVVAVSYRGFGGSTGAPSEPGLIADATAAYQYAVARYAPERIAVWGESLGGGVAVALAAERRIGKLILEAPFTSAAEVAQRTYLIFPVRLLMHDQFPSDQRIGRVTAPVLVMHGERDNVVPFDLGERMVGLIVAPKQFVRFPEGGHNDLDAFGATQVALKFLDQGPVTNR